MTTLPEVAEAMQTILTTAADIAAHKTHFTKRQSKLTGSKFTQTLVFGWLSNPQATLEELSQTAATLGVEITPQGLDQRFTQEAAECLKGVLDSAVNQLIVSDPVAIPILKRFNGVYLQDSSTIVLPDALAEVWEGCGGSTPENTASALKLQIRLNLTDGALCGPLVGDGRTNDRKSPIQSASLPPGALRIADLGYFSLDTLSDLDRGGVYWLTAVQAGTAVFDESGKRWELFELLRANGKDEIDIPIHLGAKHQIQCRLLAKRVPKKEANERRRRLRAEARHQGRKVSQLRLLMADWTIFITNVPADLLSLQEALVLGRTRWQIELLFKLWKDHGHVDESKSTKPWRILCEVYAKLLAMLIQHWLFLVSCWAYPDRSLRKAAQTVRRHALHLASSFGCLKRLCGAIAIVRRCLSAGCRINKRKASPHTYQLLLSLSQNP